MVRWLAGPRRAVEKRSPRCSNARMDGYPALQLAVRDGTVESVEALLAAGADVDARDKLVGDSPLEVADRLGFTEVMDILVRAGAEPNAR